MGTKEPQRPLFAWQYSLRAMLITMALIGVGIVIFRWPWEKREVFTDPLGYSETKLQTFRRNWKGEAVKHGLSKFGRAEEFYVDGVRLWEAQYTPEGKLQFKHYFSGDQYHGPYFAQGGAIQGEYRRGRKEGKWLATFHHYGEVVQCEQRFAANLPHGEWRWTSGGQELQRATFERGQLTAWNGRKVADELARVLEAKQVDAIYRDVLATRMEHVDFEGTTSHGGTAYEWPLLTSYHRLVLQLPMKESHEGTAFRWPRRKDPARPVGEAFVEQALLASQMLDYRFGVVCIVPIAQCELEWQDHSGVSQIRFEPGSREELAWLEPVDVAQDATADPGTRLQRLFAGTPIEIDAARFTQLPAIPNRMAHQNASTYRRPRRDLLGLYLLAHGWTCQQKGNRLEIVPKSAG